MSIKHVIAQTAAVAFGAVLLAGCGGGEEPIAAPAPGTGTPVANTPPTETDPAAASGAQYEGPDMQAGGKIGSLTRLNGGDIFDPDALVGEEAETAAETAQSVDETASTTPAATPVEESFEDAVVYDTAVVKVNDTSFTVQKLTYFPEDTQQFRVIEIGDDSIELSLTAGEFSDGSDRITLSKGKKITMVDQSEGDTYVIELVSTSSSAVGGESTSSNPGAPVSEGVPGPVTIPAPTVGSTGSTGSTTSGATAGTTAGTTTPVTTP